MAYTEQDKTDGEFILKCLDNTFGKNRQRAWFVSYENLLWVASLLDGDCRFDKTSDVIRFFEKPWKWETDMEEIANELLGITSEVNCGL